MHELLSTVLFLSAVGCGGPGKLTADFRPHVSAKQLNDVAPQLREERTATVEAAIEDRGETQAVEITATEEASVTLQSAYAGEPEGEAETRDVKLAELIANCPVVLPYRGGSVRRDPPCLLLEVVGDIKLAERELTVQGRNPFHDYEKARKMRIVGFTMMAAGALAAILCHQECGDSTKELGIGAGAVVGGLGLIIVGFSIPHPNVTI